MIPALKTAVSDDKDSHLVMDPSDTSDDKDLKVPEAALSPLQALPRMRITDLSEAVGAIEGGSSFDGVR